MAFIEGLQQLVKEITRTYLVLLRIMIPVLILVKMLEYLGLREGLSLVLSPLMGLVGLPGEMGLVWAAALLGNIYAGLAILAETGGGDLSVAQATALGVLLLAGHNLPVEGQIARHAGIPWRFTLFLRLFGALILAAICFYSLNLFEAYQQPARWLWEPQPRDDSLSGWLILQGEMLVVILLVIAALMTLLKILRLLGVETLMHNLLEPLLRKMGIGREAANVTVIGTTLGLAFGGALLLQDIRSGRLSRQDVILSMTFLSLCHSLIEDSLLIALIGASWLGILWIRLFFAILVTAAIAYFLRLPKQPAWLRFLISDRAGSR